MASRSGWGRRITWTVLIVFLLVIIVGIGTLLRSFFDREELIAIHGVLNEARESEAPLSEIDPKWDRLSESVRSRTMDAPRGSLAVLAYRAVMRLELDLPEAIVLSEHPTATVTSGNLLEREVPLPDQPFLWTVEFQSAWDRGPWTTLHRSSWGGVGVTKDEIDLLAGLPDRVRKRGEGFVRFRGILKLYLGENAEAAAAAGSPEELARVPFVFQGRRLFGTRSTWRAPAKARS